MVEQTPEAYPEENSTVSESKLAEEEVIHSLLAEDQSLDDEEEVVESVKTDNRDHRDIAYPNLHYGQPVFEDGNVESVDVTPVTGSTDDASETDFQRLAGLNEETDEDSTGGQRAALESSESSETQFGDGTLASGQIVPDAGDNSGSDKATAYETNLVVEDQAFTEADVPADEEVSQKTDDSAATGDSGSNNTPEMIAAPMGASSGESVPSEELPSEVDGSRPEDLMLSANNVDENALAGTLVGTVSVVGMVAGDAATFSLIKSSDGRFVIDPVTGTIRVSDNAQIDFETDPVHEITVRITDSLGNSYDESFQINVNDLLEGFDDLSISNNTIAENASNGTIVGQIQVDSADDALAVQFSLLNDADGRFTIDAVTGVVRVADGSQLDFESDPFHQIVVQVTDELGNTYSEQVAVNLEDINEAPTDLTLSSNSVFEKAANGTSVGTVTTTEPDAGDTPTYSLTDNAGGRFAINASTGEITVANGSLLDFDTDADHVVTVRTTDDSGNTYDESFTINLTNVNEAATDMALSANSVAENSANGTSVGTVTTTDPDAGDTPTYSLTDNAGGRFAINASTGEITVANGSLLDFDTDADHVVTVRTTDDSGNTYDESFTINLTNVNEAATDMALSANTVVENASNGTSVGTVTTTDPDAGDTPTYSLTDNAGGRFAINASTGEITVANGNLLDFDTDADHVVTVRTTDDAGNTYDESFTINLTNVNEAATDMALSANTVAENSANGTSVGTVTTTDPDAGDTPTYSLTDNAGGRFAINASTGEITVANGSLLDFDTDADHVVTVRTTDDSGNTYDESFTINLTNVNEAATDMALSANTVVENASNGTSVGTVTTTDPDAGDTPTYTLTDNAGGRFAINASTGEITVANGSLLDFDTDADHVVTVRTTDDAGNTYDESFTINLTNVNEAATDMALSANTVVENASNGTSVGTVTTTDPDAGDTPTYSLTDNAGGRFAINASTGEITVANGSLLDFDTDADHVVTVRTTDDSGNTYDESFTINLTNVNEAATDMALSANTIVENASNGTSVGTVTTTDPDAGDTPTYSLTDNAGGRFAINASTGEITVANGSLLDFDTDADHVVTVRTTDDAGNTYDESFTINLTNVNEAATDMALSANTVAENSANGTSVGTVTTTDPDAGDTPTYSLTDNAGGRFAINASTGEITVANGSLLDFDTDVDHVVTVRTTDDAGNTYDESFTINLTNVNEAATDMALSANTVVENASNGTSVGTVTTTDPDAGDTPTYSLTDNAGGRFAINASTGEITVANGSLLDFDTDADHVVTVRTTDDSGNTYDESFTINLTNVNEAATDMALSANTVVENASNGTSVGTVTTTDPDAGDTPTYSLTDNAGGRFAISASTGEITVANGSLLDFDTDADHVVTVRTTDDVGNTYDESFTINLTNINEAATDMALSANTVVENASNGTSVGTVTTTDPDAGDTPTYSLTDNAGGRFAISASTGEITVANGSLLDFDTDADHVVTVRTTDDSGNTYDESFTINLTNVNEAATDMALSANTVVENASNGTSVGTVTTTDPDAGDTPTYSLTDNAGGRFAINASTGEITVANGSLLDFDTDADHVVTVRTTDDTGNTYDESFTINLTNVNEAATDMALSANTVAENSANGTGVGTVTTTDPDAGDTPTYSLTDNAGGRFAINASTGEITVANGSLLDFDTDADHVVTVRTTDDAGNTYDESFTINLTNVNEAATDMALSANTVAENSANGTSVGTVTTTDPDAGDTPTYSLTDNAGGRFAIYASTGEITVANGSLLDFDTDADHVVTVRTTDDTGNTYDESFTINLTNVNEAATDMALSANTVAENSSNGTSVGTVTTTDPDAGDTPTYSLTDNAGGRFAINASTGEITVANGSLLDFDTDADHVVTVRTTDDSGNTYDESFTINLTNVNEAATDMALSANAVAENASNGTSVGTVTTTDPDAGDTPTYSLTDNAGGRFAINASTGEITVANGTLLDFDTDADHVVTVRTTDDTGNTYDESFTINLTNVNEAATDMALSANTVVESASNGTSVGTVTTTDPDAGDTPTYSLTDNAGGRFAINASTGEITVANGSLLDFDTDADHVVTVRTTDDAGNTYDEGFTINLTNVNEAATDMALSANTVAENSANGTSVGTVTTTDPDAGDTPTYSLTDNAGGRFAINASTGEITVANGSLLDFDTDADHVVTVRTTDDAGNTYDESFTINLTNVNEAATDMALSANTVVENASNGTGVGTVTTTDPDAGDTPTYSLTDNAGGRFAINTSTGEITVANGSLLDFDTDADHVVTVRTTDDSGNTYDESFTINLTNVNEAATDMALSANTVAENSANGTSVGTVTTTDPDAGDTPTYSLTDNAGGRFAINTSTGEITVANGNLLDFDTDADHVVTVRTTDDVGNTYDESFTINLTNVNEAATDMALSANTVAENSANGTSVGTVTTTDPDAGDTPTYSLTDNASGRFAINASTGEITVANGSLLDFDTDADHVVTVRTTDDVGNTYDESFTINLTNVNEAATDMALSANTVAENSANGTSVGTVTTTDPDAGDTPTYSLTDNAGGRFAINASTGEITVANGSLLDFDTDADHVVTVRTTDDAGNTYDESFTINLTNVNEAATDMALSANTVAENSANGTSVGTVTTTDPDAGDTPTYSLTDNAGGRFAINASTGEITVANGSLLDFDTDADHVVTVRTTDDAGNTYDESFTINLTNVNEAATDMALSANTVVENASNGTSVGTVTTTDPDASDTPTYSLTDNAGGRFAINASTGEITVANGSLLDFDTDADHVVTVRTTDDSGNTYDESFTINLTNVNEAATDMALSANTVAENSANGTSVGTVTTTDPDAGDTPTYSLTDNAGGRFAINASTGEITVANGSLLDFDTDADHVVTVRTTDDAGNTYDESFTINLTNVNEAATDMALSANTVAENSANGTSVGTVTTTDPDAGDTPTYSLTDNAGGRFAINASTGEITVANGSLLDFDTDADHVVTVRTTDDSGNTYDESFTINLTNVNEAATDMALSANTVAENSANGTSVGTVTTTDPDAGDTPTYSLTDNAGGRFAINASTGEITVANGSLLDFDTDADHVVTVRTTDDVGNTYDESFTINLTNVNEAATDMALSANTVAENSANGTSVGTVTTTDPDAGDTPTYSLTDNAGGRFAINASTGEITVANGSLLDFDTDADHVVTVRTTDDTGNTYDESFTINLTNVNEAATDMALSANTVAENSANGTSVGTVTTTDPDAGDTPTYSLTDNAGGRFAINASTGEITVANGSLLDFDTDADHVVTVRTTDDVGNTYDESFTINLTNVNEAATDMALSANTVVENASNGTSVGTVTTTDPDAGDTPTYSLTDNAGGRFAINAFTGEITVANGSLLDFDTDADHVVTVRTTDDTGNTYDESFTINLTNVNEAATDMALSANTVAENSANGTSVGTVTTTDPDAGDTPTYSLTDSAGGRFAINASTGEITVANGSLLDFDTDADHVVTVRTTDDSGNTYDESFTINLTNVNEAATDMALSANTVAENSANGTSVGTVTTTDPDAGDTPTYSLTNTASGRFAINASTGEITVANGSLLDFDTDADHVVTVRTTDDSGNTYDESFTINLTNVNEVATDMALSANAVAENSANGTSVGTVTTTDPDAGDTPTYSLTDTAGGRFAINASTGEITVANGSLLDFETDSDHVVSVRTTDSAGNTYDESFTINLSNANDAPTDLTLAANGGVSLNVDGGNNAYLYTSSGGDILGGLSAFTIEIEFSSTHTPGTYMPLFSYHAGGSSDEIELGIDNNGSDFYLEIGEVTAVVSGYDVRQILDGGEHQVSLTWDNTSGAYEIYVDGVSVASGSGIATGQTIASGGTIVLGQEQDSLGGGFDSAQYFDGTYHDVRIFNDVRTASEISNNAFAPVSNGESGLIANWQMDALSGGVTDTVSGNNLSVGNATGTGFTTSTPTLTTTITENAPNGKVVGAVSSTDQDSGETFTYSLTDDAGGRFAIDASTGEITVANGSLLDYETATSHVITVRTQDSGGATYDESFTLNLSDANDAPTDLVFGANSTISTSSYTQEFSGLTHQWKLDGNAVDSVGGNDGTITGATTVTGHDDDALRFDESGDYVSIPDVTMNNEFTISFQFRIDENSGSLFQYLYSHGDINGANSINVFLSEASHGSDPNMMRTVIRDSNDTLDNFALEFDISNIIGDGGWHTYTLTVESGVGSKVYLDGALQNSDSRGGDSIDPSGPVYLGARQDLNVDRMFGGDMDNVQIYNRPLTSSEANDLHNTPAEAIAANTVVANITSVIDPDVGDTHTYVLTDDAGGKFQIDANGNISLVADHDISSAYSDTVTVQVTDSVGNTYSETIGISFGTAGSDSITGGVSSDIIYGFGGGDTLNGGDGDDVLIGGTGGDVINGGDGTDTVSYSAAIEYVDAIADYNPIMHLRLDATSDGLTGSNGYGETATDETGNHSGTYNGGTDPGATGPIASDPLTAVEFDGTDEYVTIPSSTDFGMANGTISMWFNVDTSSGEGTLMSIESASDTDGLSLTVKNDYIIFTLKGGGSSHTIQTSAGSVTANQWHNVAVSFGSGGIELYIDGTLAGSDSYTGGLTDIGEPVVIGASQESMTSGSFVSGNLTKFFDGEIAEVSMFDSALSESDIDRLIEIADTGVDPNGGVTVNLATGLGVGGQADGDTITNVENVVGTEYNDVLTGDANDNVLTGGAGNDSLVGGAGDDSLYGGAGADSLYGEDGNDTFFVGDGTNSDAIYGGIGGSWTDAINLEDESLAGLGTDWTISFTSGSQAGTTDGAVILSQDSSGTIALSDGGTITFEGVERIEF